MNWDDVRALVQAEPDAPPAEDLVPAACRALLLALAADVARELGLARTHVGATEYGFRRGDFRIWLSAQPSGVVVQVRHRATAVLWDAAAQAWRLTADGPALTSAQVVARFPSTLKRLAQEGAGG